MSYPPNTPFPYLGIHPIVNRPDFPYLTNELNQFRYFNLNSQRLGNFNQQSKINLHLPTYLNSFNLMVMPNSVFHPQLFDEKSNIALIPFQRQKTTNNSTLNNIKPKIKQIETIVIDDDEQQNITKNEAIQQIVNLEKKSSVSLQKKQIEIKPIEKSNMVLRGSTKGLVKLKNKEKKKQQVFKVIKVKNKIQKKEKPQKIILKGQRQSNREKKEKLIYTEYEMRQINKGQETSSRVRIGKQFQCILPQLINEPQQKLIWLDEKRQNLLSRKFC